MKNYIRFLCLGLLFLSFAAFLFSCAAPTDIEIVETTKKKIVVDKDERLVFLPMSETEDSFLGWTISQCLKDDVVLELPELMKVMPADEFQNLMFPWFETNIAPRSIAELGKLLAEPIVRARISQIKVRYVIVATNQTLGDANLSGIFCGGAGYGAGCFGMGKQEKITQMTAVIWDLHRGTLIDEVTVTSSGTTVIPALLVPFPFIAYTEFEACEHLARRLGEILEFEN